MLEGIEDLPVQQVRVLSEQYRLSLGDYVRLDVSGVERVTRQPDQAGRHVSAAHGLDYPAILVLQRDGSEFEVQILGHVAENLVQLAIELEGAKRLAIDAAQG